jgi:hypothetical protein
MQIVPHPSAAVPTALDSTAKPTEALIETARASHVIEMPIHRLISKTVLLFGVEFYDLPLYVWLRDLRRLRT